MSKRCNVLVTGVGGGSGFATLKILHRTRGYNVIAADSDPDAVGLHCNTGKTIVIPTAHSTDFIDATKKIIQKYHIDIVLPNVDEELPIWANRCNFGNVVISPLSTIEICLDKSKTYQKLQNTNRIPRFYPEEIVDFPLCIKPKCSRGSRNIYIVYNVRELGSLIQFLESQGLFRSALIISEYLPGKEYTIDTMFDFSGNLITFVPRQRIQTKNGISIVGETVPQNRFQSIVEQIGQTMTFYGPVNIQVKEDKDDGILKLLEINPRLSGGLPITHRSGINFPHLACELFQNKNPFFAPYRSGVKTYRYLEEIS